MVTEYIIIRKTVVTTTDIFHCKSDGVKDAVECVRRTKPIATTTDTKTGLQLVPANGRKE